MVRIYPTMFLPRWPMGAAKQSFKFVLGKLVGYRFGLCLKVEGAIDNRREVLRDPSGKSPFDPYHPILNPNLSGANHLAHGSGGHGWEVCQCLDTFADMRASLGFNEKRGVHVSKVGQRSPTCKYISRKNNLRI